jgi:hypothetical protein
MDGGSNDETIGFAEAKVLDQRKGMTPTSMHPKV